MHASPLFLRLADPARLTGLPRALRFAPIDIYIHADGMLDMYDLKDPHRLLLRNVQLQLNAMQWQPLDDSPFDDGALSSKVTSLCDYLFADLCKEKGSCLKLGSA